MLTSQVKRQFTSEEIRRVLEALGSDPPLSQGDDLIFQTICHNPPHAGKYKLYYYHESGMFHCYTECGDSFDIYELVQRNHHCSFREALLFIQQILGLTFERKIGFGNSVSHLTDDWDILNRISERKERKIQHIPPYTAINPNLLNTYSNIYPIEWQHEFIKPEAMERYHIRFDVAQNEVIIPHYSIDDTLIGIRSRSFNLEKIANGNKYMPTMLEGHEFNHSLRYNLYGLNVVKEAVKRTGKIFLCEAEKSSLQSYSYYGENSFCCSVCGSNISTAQRDLILNLGVREVFLGFDKEFEEAYTPQSDQYAEKILRLAGLFTPYCVVYVIWDCWQLLQYKDSPTDRGKDILEELMRKKFEVSTISRLDKKG